MVTESPCDANVSSYLDPAASDIRSDKNQTCLLRDFPTSEDPDYLKRDQACPDGHTALYAIAEFRKGPFLTFNSSQRQCAPVAKYDDFAKDLKFSQKWNLTEFASFAYQKQFSMCGSFTGTKWLRLVVTDFSAPGQPTGLGEACVGLEGMPAISDLVTVNFYDATTKALLVEGRPLRLQSRLVLKNQCFSVIIPSTLSSAPQPFIVVEIPLPKGFLPPPLPGRLDFSQRNGGVVQFTIRRTDFSPPTPPSPIPQNFILRASSPVLVASFAVLQDLNPNDTGLNSLLKSSANTLPRAVSSVGSLVHISLDLPSNQSLTCENSDVLAVQIFPRLSNITNLSYFSPYITSPPNITSTCVYRMLEVGKGPARGSSIHFEFQIWVLPCSMQIVHLNMKMQFKREREDLSLRGSQPLLTLTLYNTERITASSYPHPLQH